MSPRVRRNSLQHPASMSIPYITPALSHLSRRVTTSLEAPCLNKMTAARERGEGRVVELVTASRLTVMASSDPSSTNSTIRGYDRYPDLGVWPLQSTARMGLL